MNKRAYFLRLDLLIVVVGLLLSIGVYFGSELNYDNQWGEAKAPINSSQLLEASIEDLPGIRQANANVYGNSAVIELEYDSAVRRDQSLYLEQQVQNLVVNWDNKLVHCKINKRLGFNTGSFKPY